MNTIDDIRKQFPFLNERVYLDHASVAPMASSVVARMQSYLIDRSVGQIADADGLFQFLARLREKIAKFIHAESGNTIAFVTNTTTGLNILARGLSLKPGDRILLTNCEFPANVFPFLNLENEGILVDFVPCRDGRIPTDDIMAAITPKTRLISLSLVEFFSGFRHDVKTIGELCRAKGIVFALDAIQALGAIQVDVQDWHVDFLATGGQKWLLAPMGTGFIYVAPGLLEKLKVANLGWIGMRDAWNFFDYSIRLLDTAARFELGSLPFIALHGLDAALDLLNQFSHEQREKRVLENSAYLIDRLRELGFRVITPEKEKERAGIVLFSAAEENERIHAELRAQNITISLREKHLRVSPHFYNTKEDLDRFLEGLCRIAKN